MSKVVSYCSVRLPEIVNFYVFQVIFWELASKDKIYCVNISYPKGFMSHICNQLCEQCSFERNDNVCEGLILLYILYFGLCYLNMLAMNKNKPRF